MVGCHSSRSNDLSVHARIVSRGYVRLLWESSEEEDKKFGKKAEGVITDSRERTADTLFNDLECVALAIEGSDLNTTENSFVPTAKCIIQDTKERTTGRPDQVFRDYGVVYAISTTSRQ